MSSDDDDLSCDDDNYYSDEMYDGGDDVMTGIPDHYEYTVLKESDIRQRQDADIASVAGVYSVSRSAASLLLRHFNWNVNRLSDAWIIDEQAVRRSVGLLVDHPQPFPSRHQGNNNKKIQCTICFDSRRIHDFNSAACGHRFCTQCWAGYIGASLTDARCLALRCPMPSCGAAVGEDMILKLTNEDGRKRYFTHMVRSYVEDQRTTKWCPAPGCEYVVDFADGSGGYDVNCLCSHWFCWNCSEEAHQPVDCQTVRSWIAKNSSESQNVTWILAYTKPCPKCKRPIEKNKGCNHMTCNSACGHQFCWSCLSDWNAHGTCNAFKSEVKERAKMSLERYTHYYERWANNHKSRLKAINDLKEVREKHVEKIKNVQIVGDRNKENMAEFLAEAWEQIIECRRVLKWTYAYGYFIPENEKVKKDFFEYLQGEAEKGLERLHSYAEEELKPYLKATCRSESFDRFRMELVSLTKVTKTYFENLVKALQNGLVDIRS